MKILGIAAGPDNEFSVLLADSEDKFVLPIAIGPFEAQAIAIPLSGDTPPRPLTHDLLKSVCDAMGGVVQHIIITGINYMAPRLVEFTYEYKDIIARE